MECSRCGKELKGDSKYCAQCGNPLGEEGDAGGGLGSAHASGDAAHPPSPAGQDMFPPSEKKKGRGGLIALLMIAALLIVGGMASLLIWKLAAGGGLKGEIIEVELSRKGGGSVNLEDVPLGEDLVIKIRVRAE